MAFTVEDYIEALKRYGRRQIEGIDAATALVTGMAAQVPAGLGAISRYYLERGRGTERDQALARAVEGSRGTQEALTYTPRTEGGQHTMQNIGETMEKVEGKIADSPAGRAWQDFTEYSPSWGASLAAVAGAAGPKGAKVKPKKAAVGSVFDTVSDPAVARTMALRGEHLKTDPEGKYIGAPEWVTSGQSLGKLRSDADASVAAGVFNADWYERQRNLARILSSDPTAQSLFARGTAAYSPQAMPKVELPAFLRQHNEAMLSGNTLAQPRTGSQARNVAQAYEIDPTTGAVIAFHPDRIRLGRKTGPYADAKDPTVDEGTLYRTANDIWHGRVMGYGKDFDRGFTPQEHGFLTGENLLLAERAQAAGLPVTSPRSAQAATWGATRFEDYKAGDAKRFARETRERERYERNPERWLKRNRRRGVLEEGEMGPPPSRPKMPPKKTPAPVRTDAELRADASAGLDTALPRQSFYLTPEAIPGYGTGHFRELIDADPALKQRYTDDYMRATGRDPMIEAMRLYSREPTGGLQGTYTNSAGIVENQPAWSQAVAVSNVKKKGEGVRTPEIELDALRSATKTGAYLRGQEAGAGHRFIAEDMSPSVAGMNGARVRDATPQELAALRSAGLTPIHVEPNVHHVTRFGDDGPIVGSHKDVEAVLGKDRAERGTLETIYESGITGNVGTGEATDALIQTLRKSPVPPARASGRTAEVAGLYNDIDRALADETGFKAREDLLRARDIIKQGGLQGLIDYVAKHGSTGLPAVVLGALGLQQGLAMQGEPEGAL